MSASAIFGKDAEGIFTYYDVELKFVDLVVGGVPSDESIIRKWISAKLELGDAALEELVQETIESRDAVLSVDDKLDLIMKTDQVNVNGFKRDPGNGELVLEGRIIKAALKEWISIAFPGSTLPKVEKPKGVHPNKGGQALLAEKIFVLEGTVGLGVKEPARIEERVKHISTPKGPRSAISRVEVVERPSISFTVKAHKNWLSQKAWAEVWVLGEEIGLGSDRGRSDGKFTLERWVEIPAPKLD